jgi:hypothetical protein
MVSDDQITQWLDDLNSSAILAIASLRPEDHNAYRERFEEVGFVQVPNIVDPEVQRNLYAELLARSRSSFDTFWQPERPDLGRQKTGHSMKRAYLEPERDSDRFGDTAWQARRDVLNRGIERLSRQIEPLINSIVGSCSFSCSSIFLYTEHDYLGLHNDASLGDRVNALLPLSLNTVGGIRVLYKERLKTYYDLPGGLNVLGPRVWHDVPPILRFHADADPARMNLTMRYV